MRIKVGDASLFVEVVGTKLGGGGAPPHERPTLVLLHGGPAWDHRTLLPDFAPLREEAQLVFYDHRGLGRSDAADSRSWTLKQWAADLKALIDALGLERPIVFGQSFGGIVAQQFAIDHVGAYSGLILSATMARFDLEAVAAIFRGLGGDRLERLARAFFTASDAGSRDQFLIEGLAHYTVSRRAIGATSPFKPDVLDHFFARNGEAHRFDFRPHLAAIEAPTLILGGDADPVAPPSAVLELAAAFRRGVADVHILENCGHGPARDRPETTLALIRDFIGSRGAAAGTP